MNVGILIFPEIEILDFSGPFEVFSIATRVAQRDKDANPAPFNAFLVAETSDVVTARYGYLVKPHYRFDDHPKIDLLIVPGGIIDQPRRSRATMDWIERVAGRAEIVSSVCTGAFLLAQLRLLDGQKATTHWEDLERLQREFPNVEVIDNQIFVDQGRIITSAGISAGIDMSLHLVSKLQSPGLAQRAARQMVYPWQASAT
jgi:transcriptional regulator GlxA family with amidase domain